MTETGTVAITVTPTGVKELSVDDALLLLMERLGLNFVWAGSWVIQPKTPDVSPEE